MIHLIVETHHEARLLVKIKLKKTQILKFTKTMKLV